MTRSKLQVYATNDHTPGSAPIKPAPRGLDGFIDKCAKHMRLTSGRLKTIPNATFFAENRHLGVDGACDAFAKRNN